jgi:hypothetical protein
MAAMQEHFPVVGVLGGGQLGRMMAEAGHNMGVRVAILDPKGEQSPAGMVTRDAYTGDFKDEATVKKFCADSGCSVLTVRHMVAAATRGRLCCVVGVVSVVSACVVLLDVEMAVWRVEWLQQSEREGGRQTRDREAQRWRQ